MSSSSLSPFPPSPSAPGTRADRPRPPAAKAASAGATAAPDASSAQTPAPVRAAPRKPDPRRLAPVLIGVALLGYLGYRLYLARQPYEWSGTVEARTILVGSRAGGRVKEVLVREGETVTAGQALVVLEPGDLLAQQLQARGQLEQAQAMLEKLKRGSRPEEIAAARARALNADAALAESRAGARSEQIAAADARLAAQQAALEKAQLDEQRARRLFSSGAASRAELDNAATSLRSAQAQRETTSQQLDELRHGSRREDLLQAEARALEAKANARLTTIGSRVEDINAAQGQVDAAQGRLDQVGTLITELTVRAPRPARVEALDLRPGDIVAPNATCATLLEEDQLYVRIYVPETQLGHIRVGLEVPVTVDSFPDRTFKGMVEHINSVGEYSPRNLQTADERADQVFAARVGLRGGKEQRDTLRAGMAAFIQVPK